MKGKIVMGIYKQYKHGGGLQSLVKEYGVRRTFNALRRQLGRTQVRLKHNKLQIKNRSNNWKYT